MEKLYIKSWFYNKLVENNSNDFSVGMVLDYGVALETEKAYLFCFDFETRDGEYGFSRKYWVPKSCTTNVNEVALEIENDYQRYLQNMEKGKAKYDKLVAWAKAQGLPVRNRLKTSTIMKIINEAGLVYNA